MGNNSIFVDTQTTFINLYENACLYFLEIIFVSLLSLITVFRREMSCNAVYTDTKADSGRDTDGDVSDDDLSEEERYPLLNSYAYSKSLSLSRSSQDLTKLYKYNNPPSNNGSDSTTIASTLTHNAGDPHSHQHPINLLELPSDIQIKCFTFLYPKDVLNFSCVNCRTYDMVSNENVTVPAGDGNVKVNADADADAKENSMSNVLWYQLFLRDYASILTHWHAGMKAVERSRNRSGGYNNYDHENDKFNCGSSRWHCPDRITSLLTENGKHENDTHHRRQHHLSSSWKPSMKEFYLVFSQTWLEYSIAGQTQNPTLVGIHGHVFDMTSFLEEHPGSPETIIMQGGGRDATNFFESVGHSRSARSLALERLLEVVDMGCCSVSTLALNANERGNYRRRQRSSSTNSSTSHHHEGGYHYDRCISTSGYGDSSLELSHENGLRIVSDPKERDLFLEDTIASRYRNVLPQKRSEMKRTPGTLYHTRVKLTREAKRAKVEARAKVTREMSERGEMDILGNVNIYFDPLCYCWKGWYLNLDFQSVFVHDIRNVR